MKKLFELYDNAIALISGKIPEALSLLLVRFALATPFWFSARTKVEEGSFITMNDVQPLLFENEFGMPFPETTALIATWAEHILPILIVLGLFTRIGASGLMVMTAVIQFFVFPDAWPTHILWAALALTLIVRGGGSLTLDNLLSRNRGGPS